MTGKEVNLTEKSGNKISYLSTFELEGGPYQQLPKMTLRRIVRSVLRNPYLIIWTVLACCGALYLFYGFQTFVKVSRYAQIGQFSTSLLEESVNLCIPNQNLSEPALSALPEFKDTPPKKQFEKKDTETHHTFTENSQKGVLSVTGEARPKFTHDRGQSKRLGDLNNMTNSIGRQHIHIDRSETFADTLDMTSLEDEILKLQAERKQRIADVCHEHKLAIGKNAIFGETYRHMYVIDEQKLLFCYIPKVACSNWKRVLMVLDRKRNNTDDITSREAHAHNGITRLGTISKAERAYRLQNYRKVMFVRDPLARVVSAYKNKFADLDVYRTAPPVFHKFGKRIVKRYRKNPSRLALETGENVTFAEFVRYLTNKDERSGFDRHWKEMYKLCSPCQIQYDFIGKLEEAYDEAEYVLRNMNFTRSLSFPGRENSHPTNVSGSSTDKYFENFSNKTLWAIWNIYRADYELFGYKKPHYIK